MEELTEYNCKLNKIKYGWYDKKNNLHVKLTKDNFIKNYRMQKPEEIEKHGYAICWDICELERKYLEETGLYFKTVLAIIKKGRKKPCHSFLIFQKNNKFYWFESSWEKMKGIREYETLEELLLDIVKKFDDFIPKNSKLSKKDIEFYEYKKPKQKINCISFLIHTVVFGKKIKYK